jgi:ABC-type glycerol-3-phosphate transport system permease component
MMKHAKKNWWAYLLIAGFILTFNIPILFTILNSLKTNQQILTQPPVWIFKPILEHYERIFSDANFPVWFYLKNSMSVSVIGTILTILIAFPAAYTMARNNTGGERYEFWLLSTRMLPGAVFIIPTYVLFSSLGLVDSIFGLILIYLSFNLPLAIWIIRGFIREIPLEIDEAAGLDGASTLQVMRRIIFPMTAPGLIAVAVLTFAASWNEYFFSLVFTDLNATTFTVAGQRFMTGHAIMWGEISAAVTVAIIPVIMVAFIFQRFMVKGLSMGAVK